MKKVAILIDGGFLSVTFKKINKRYIRAQDVKEIARKTIRENEEIFRIYYYDAPPFDKKLINPINHSETDYIALPSYKAISLFHRKLAEMPYVAFRKGKLAFGGWKLTREAIEDIKTGKIAEGIKPHHITPQFKQKAVDMRIGLDIAWMSMKRIVDKIVLITADNDFIPVMKFARKEGLHIAIAKIEELTSDMLQHADEIIEVKIQL